MIAVVSFLGGLVGLLVGGHIVVDMASRIGSRFGLTPIVIGLTIVAAGTSAPELAVVFQSIAADDTELAVGSIIGSNIANVLLVLGLAAAWGTIHVTIRVVRVDIPIMIGASVAFLVMSIDGRLSRLDGLVLFSSLVGFVVWTLRAAPKVEPDLRGPDVRTDGPEFGKSAEGPGRTLNRDSLSVQIAGLVVGTAILALAARYVVSGAEQIAVDLGVPRLIIGLTIVALGTSAPEIVTTLIAAFRGRRDLAVGNAVGSNIFNILLVLGSTATLAPSGIDIGTDAIELDLPILVAAAVACLPIVFWDGKIDRWEGVVFVAYYGAYLLFLVLDATGHRASDPFAFVLLAFVTPLTVITAIVVIIGQHRSESSSMPPNRQPITGNRPSDRYILKHMLTAPETEIPPWTFLTNHAHVLIAIGRDSELRQRDIAYAVGITVGAVQRIIHELEEGGYIRTERVGRRNRYEVIDSKPLRHPLENNHTVRELLTSLEP